MKKFDIFSMALRNFMRRKARSLLTIMGVVIGTAAIVIMISIGNALSVNSMKQLESWGSLTTISVRPSGGGGMGGGMASMSSNMAMETPTKPGGAGQKEINDDKIKEMLEVEHIIDVMPRKDDSAMLVSGKYVTWVTLQVCDISKLEAFDVKAEKGRLNTKEDENGLLFGYYVANNFYDPKASNPWAFNPNAELDENGNPLPKVDIFTDKVQLTFDTNYGSNQTVPVVDEITVGQGSVKKKSKLYDINITGRTGMYDNSSWGAYMDIEDYRRMKREYLKTQSTGDKSAANQIKALSNYDYVDVKVDDIDNVQAVTDELTKMGYQAHSMIESVLQMQKQAQTIQMILGGIGAMSLLVAAIGIANTMVMSIYERTKEIGIMKVIGCKLGDIRTLFLSEAGIIGFTGGVVGVGISYIAGWVMNQFGDAFASAIGGGGGGGMGMMAGAMGEVEKTLICIIPGWLPIAAIGFAMVVGLISGFYPARRAMRLSALEAIRNE